MAKFNEKEQFCRFCLSTVRDTNFTVIEDSMKNILNLVLPNHQFDDENSNIMCSSCCAKLIAAFQFKSACLDTDYIIKTFYIDYENKLPLDIKNIYVKEISDTRLSDALDVEKVCRLCMQLVMSEYTSIHEVDLDVIHCYIPEINFDITMEPVLCNKCLNSLHMHTAFLKISIKSLEITKHSSSSDGKIDSLFSSPVKLFFKTENIETKFPEDEQNGFIQMEEIKIKSEEIHIISDDSDSESSTPSHNSGNEDAFASYSDVGHKSSLTHTLPHEAKPYKCDKCCYETNYNYNLKRHCITHMKSSKTQIYKCDNCSYRSQDRSNFKKHYLKHIDASLQKMYSSKVKMYKCDNCSYKSKDRSNFRKHYLKHIDISLLKMSSSEVQMYRCDNCSYETKDRSNFRKHYLKHTEATVLNMYSSEGQMYQCHNCRYETKDGPNFKKHYLQHIDVSRLKIYKCDKCDYETKEKNNLSVHSIFHEDSLI